ncbi:MAG: FUSC family protein [Actinophytocola sp.]|nr:FUSC family protein [Actinophytocola sp.]
MVTLVAWPRHLSGGGPVLRRLTTPGAQPVIQAAKAGLAAVAAWLLARHALSLPQPFLAPYAAVFLVESTVYRSLWLSVQQVGAVAIGVALAGVAAVTIPSSAVAIGVVTAVGLLLGRWRGFGSSGMWIGITALLVITYGTAEDPMSLLYRLVEIALGAALGLVVNAVLLPPVYLRRPQQATAELAETLCALLHGLASTLRAEACDEETGNGADDHDWTDHARAAEKLVRQGEDAISWAEESARLNLRQRRRQRWVAQAWQSALVSMRSAWPHLREITEAAYVTASERPLFGYPDPESRRALAGVFDELAEAITQRGQPGGSIDAARDALTRADEALRELEDRIFADGDVRLDTAVGLASMLLPTSKATAELRL